MTGHQIPVNASAETAAELQRRYRVPIWFGNHTHRYWALVANQLVEAETATALGRQLEASFLPPRRP